MKIKAKKSLGQNFLIDKNIIKKIIDCDVIKNKNILEVGPGTGNLTKEILKKNPKKFFVVEKDKILLENLRLELNKNLIYINNDILKISEKELIDDKLTIFGNLPYNISSQILTKWINMTDDFFWFDKLILLFQKEVAERILSKPNSKNYGRLSILVNWKLSVKKVIDISPHCFSPKPKIDSTLLVFEPKNDFIKINKSKNLEKITRIFFNQRRKKIKKPYFQLFKNDEIANNLNIDLNLRPQNINEKTFYLLTKEYEKLIS